MVGVIGSDRVTAYELTTRIAVYQFLISFLVTELLRFKDE